MDTLPMAVAEAVDMVATAERDMLAGAEVEAMEPKAEMDRTTQRDPVAAAAVGVMPVKPHQAEHLPVVEVDMLVVLPVVETPVLLVLPASASSSTSSTKHNKETTP